jgi:hypothetical protein
MSKYPFFGKKGRPTKVEVEICKKINSLLDAGKLKLSDISEIIETNGVPMNETELETLYSLATGEEPIVSKKTFSGKSSEEFSQTEEIADDLNEEFTADSDSEEFFDNPIPKSGSNKDAIDFDPFAEPVVDRSYTSGQVKDTLGDSSEQTDDNYLHDETGEREEVKLDEDDFKKPNPDVQSGDGISDAEYEEDIPEPKFEDVTSSVDENGNKKADTSVESKPTEKLGGDNNKDLSPAQKRKGAEKTADAIIKMYGDFAPLPFIKWASFSDLKIRKLALEGRIDLDMQLESGVTVKEYIDGMNEQVQEVFKVSKETKEDIKEPLIDVLMEQELALTPTQRLMMALGTHIIQMGFSAFSLSQQNKMALEAFEKYHSGMKRNNGATRSDSEQPQARVRETKVNYANQTMSKHDKMSVEELMREIEKDDVIDPRHDPRVTVEDVENED